MKIAIVHDWLVTYAGAERVLEQMLHVFPQADLFSLIDFIPEGSRNFILDKSVQTTFIQNMPFAIKKYRSYLPLMPLAIEQLDLSKYDLVISSSHAVAKGVITGPDQLHVSYVNTPIRYAWDLQHQYLREANLESGLKGWIARIILHYMRMWDFRTSNGVDYFVANSNFIARRIWKVYRREAKVIYPPVNIEGFTLREQKDDFFLTVSRMVPYKKMDLIVETFNTMPDKKLVVIGDGPDFGKIRAKASDNVELLGYQPFEILRDYLQRARAFVFAAEEDFGITLLEAQACGTPVIAYGKGGALETVNSLRSTNQPTGVFFHSQTVESLRKAVINFEKEHESILPQYCRKNAERFGENVFRQNFGTYINAVFEHNKRQTQPYCETTSINE